MKAETVINGPYADGLHDWDIQIAGLIATYNCLFYWDRLLEAILTI